MAFDQSVTFHKELLEQLQILSRDAVDIGNQENREIEKKNCSEIKM